MPEIHPLCHLGRFPLCHGCDSLHRRACRLPQPCAGDGWVAACGVRWRAAATRWLLLLLARELGDRVGRRRQVGGGEDGLRNPAVGGRLLRGVLQPVGAAGQLERPAGDAGPARRSDASAGPAPVPRRSPSATGPAAGSSARRRRRPRSSPRRFRHPRCAQRACHRRVGRRSAHQLVEVHVRRPGHDRRPIQHGRQQVEPGTRPQQPENDSNLSWLPWLVTTGSARIAAITLARV
jgi:hypothetical protein